MNNYSCPPNSSFYQAYGYSTDLNSTFCVEAQSNSRFLPQDYSAYHAQAQQQAYTRSIHEHPPGQLRMPMPYDNQSQWNTHEVNNYLLQHQAPPPPPPPPPSTPTTPSTSAPTGTRRRSSRFDLRPDDRRERRRFHDQNGASLPPPQRPTVLPQSSNPTPHANGTHRTSSAPSGDVSLHPRGSPPPPQLPFPRRRPLTTNYPQEYPLPYQAVFQQNHGQHTRSQNSHRPSHPSQHQDYRQKQIESNKQSARRQFTQKPPHHQHQVQRQSLVQQHKQESSKDHRDYQKRSSPSDRNHRRDDPTKAETPKNHHRSGSRFGQPPVISNVQRTPPTDNVSDKVMTSPPESSDPRGDKRSPNLKEPKIQETKAREEKKAHVQPKRRKLKTITKQHIKRLKKSDTISYYLAKELEKRKRVTNQHRVVQKMRWKDQLSSSGKSSLSAALRHFSAIVEQIVTEGNWAYTSPTVVGSEKDGDKTSPNKNVKLRKRKVVKKEQNVQISTPATISPQTEVTTNESGKNLQPLPSPSTSKHPDKAPIEKPNGTRTQQSQTATDPNPFFNFDATAFDINFDGLTKTENDKEDDVDVDMESPISENDDDEILEDALKLDEEKTDAQQDPRVIPRNLIASSAEVEEKKPPPPPPLPRGKAKPKSKLKKKGKKPAKPSQKMTMTWVGVIVNEMTKPKELRAEYLNEIMLQTQRLMNHFADRWEEFEQMFEENQDPQISERGQMLIKLFSAVRRRQDINWRIFEDETPPDSYRSFKKFAKKAVAGELAKALSEHEPEMFDFSPFAKYMDPKDVLVANPELEGSFYNRLYAPQFYGFDDGSVGPYFDPKKRPKRKRVEETSEGSAKGATNAKDGSRKVRVTGKRKRVKFDRVMRKRVVRGHVRSSEIRRIPPPPPPRPKYEGMKKNEIPLHEKISRHPKSKFCPSFNWARCPTTECVLTHQCSCCEGNHPACLCPAACMDWNAGFDDCKAKGKEHVKKHRCVICGKSNGTHRGVGCPLINPHVAHQVAQAARRNIRQQTVTLRADQWKRCHISKSAVDAAIQRGGYAACDKNPCFNPKETASLNGLRKIYGAAIYKTKALRYGPGTRQYKKGVEQVDQIRKLRKKIRGKRKRKVNQRSVVGVKRGIGETQEPKPPERGRQPACHDHANKKLWPSPKKKARIEVKHS